MNAAIGTVRPEEAMAANSDAGYHEFHEEAEQGTHGSFEVFFHDGTMLEVDSESMDAGWYWWACFPGCMPDGEPSGPFASSAQAMYDADEWHPDNK